MGYNLPAMVKRTGRRRNVTLRPIIPTVSQATDLASIYAPAWRIWADNIDRILAGYDPQPLPTSDTLTIDTADQVQAAINGVANEFLTILTARITPSLRDWIVRAERVHREKWAAAVKAGVGVDLDMMLGAGEVQEALSTFLQRNVALVTNVSDQAKGRIDPARDPRLLGRLLIGVWDGIQLQWLIDPTADMNTAMQAFFAWAVPEAPID